MGLFLPYLSSQEKDLVKKSVLLGWNGSIIAIQPWENSKSLTQCCQRRFISYFTTSFLLSGSSMKSYRYSVGQIFRGIPFLVPTVQNVASRIRHATSMDSNHLRFLCVSSLKRKFHIRPSSQDLLLCGSVTSVAACMNTSILILSSIIIFRFHADNFPSHHLLFLSSQTPHLELWFYWF